MRSNVRIGDQYGRWTVIGHAEQMADGRKRFLCRCQCGNVRAVRSDMLCGGESLSCGCLRLDKISTHKKTSTRLYNIWHKMKERCYNPNHAHYINYGGRGIAVCDEWKNNFQAFYDWATQNGYQEHLTLDRIDNSKGYSPSNCRWASAVEQQNNTRRNRLLTMNGEVKSVAAWSRERHIPYSTIYSRLTSGWSIEDALTKPNHRLSGGLQNEYT